MSTESKLMGHVDPVTKRLTNIKRYAYPEYYGSPNLVELEAFPTTPKPWLYDAATQSAVTAQSCLTLEPSEITVDPTGEGQISVRITGPRSTVITAAFSGMLPIDGVEHTTDGGGQTFVRFDQGKGLRSSEPVMVKFCPRSGIDLVPAFLTVHLR
jgi:hypothetical protein